VESDIVGGKMNHKLISVMGFPAWEKIPVKEMDMEKHVKVVDDGDEMGELEVFQVMRTIQDKPIVNMAPWEVYVIPRFSYNKNNSTTTKYYAVIYRIHHAIMDGMTKKNSQTDMYIHG
jgi:hypothetical protein